MNYTECLAYLEKLGDEVLTMKLGLQNIRSLLEALDQPQLQFPSVVVAGTNGKGSVSNFLNAITTACGIRTGLYTSPHLVKVEERFVVGGSIVEPEVLASCLTRVKDTIARLQAYAAAGAHVLYAPGLTDIDPIRQLVQALEPPVNVLCMPGGPEVAELAAAGVARISVGGAFFNVAMNALAAAGREWREKGSHGFWQAAIAGIAATSQAFED